MKNRGEKDDKFPVKIRIEFPGKKNRQDEEGNSGEQEVKSDQEGKSGQQEKSEQVSKNGQEGIPSSIEECESIAKEIFENSSDIVIQVIETVKGKAMIAYVDGLASKDLTDRDIVWPLKSKGFDGDPVNALQVSQYLIIDNIPSFVGQVLQGNTVVFYENFGKAIVVDFKSWEKRSVDTPDAEAVVRGPKEGFNETIRSNTALLRRKIRTPDLKMENISIGRQTNTNIVLAYIDGIVNQEVLKELKRRLSFIDTDAILESGYIEQFIEDNSLSPLSTVGMTQKPDIVAAKILEGRVAILCDGTPHVLTVPQLFIENIQVSEDYYNRVLISSFLRFFRTFALLVSVGLPGFYVAVTTFNFEMIPTVFFVSLISASEKIPLPVGAEMFFLLIMFELLRESGTRLPRAIGSAISIVGALIVGEAAVNAGIVSAPTVIIIALTAVASFIIPKLTEFMTLYRFFFLFLGATMGLIGICSGLFIMLTQIASKTSFGVPMLSSFNKEEMKDAVVRFPLYDQIFRPVSIAKQNRRRQTNWKQKEGSQ
jgi:spore germination protein KA